MRYNVYVRIFNEYNGTFRTTTLTNNGRGYSFDEALKECDRYDTYGYDTWFDEMDA